MTNDKKTEIVNILHFKGKSLVSQFQRPKIEKVFGFILIGSYDYIVTEFGNIYKKTSKGFEKVDDQALIDMAHAHIKDISGYEFADSDISNDIAILKHYENDAYLQDPSIQEIVGTIGVDGKTCHITSDGDVYVDYLEDRDAAYNKAELVMDIDTKKYIIDLYRDKIAHNGVNEKNV